MAKMIPPTSNRGLLTRSLEDQLMEDKDPVSNFSSLRIAHRIKTSLRHLILDFKYYEDGVSHKVV